MTQPTEAKTTIILPTDVDDLYGFGVTDALEMCGIDRDTDHTLADMIEEQWLTAYRRHTADELTAAGWTVILADGSIGSPEVDDLDRRHADDLADIDELPCNMSVVAQAAKDELWAWWQANAKTLIAQHGALRCVVCGDVEETCYCINVGQSPDEVRAAIVERMGDGVTDDQADAMAELLGDRGWLAENDNGLWFIAEIQDGVWLDLVEQVAMDKCKWVLNTEEYRNGEWRDCGDVAYGDDDDADDAIANPEIPDDFGPGRYRIRARIVGQVDSERWSEPVFVAPPTMLLDLAHDHCGGEGQFGHVSWLLLSLDGDGGTEMLFVGDVPIGDELAVEAETLDKARAAVIGHLVDNGLALDTSEVRIQPSSVHIDDNEPVLARYDVLVMR